MISLFEILKKHDLQIFKEEVTMYVALEIIIFKTNKCGLRRIFFFEKIIRESTGYARFAAR